MLLLLLLGFGGCPEPPAPPEPPPPPTPVAPARPPGVRCVTDTIPQAGPAASVLRLELSDGHSQEIGPFPGTCAEASVPQALCAVRCGEGAAAQDLKAGWDGAHLAVWSRPADAGTPWARVWVATGPAIHQ